MGKLSFAHFAQGLNLHELMSSCIGWCYGAVQGIGELLVKPISVRIEPLHCCALVVYLCPHFVHLVTRVERSISTFNGMTFSLPTNVYIVYIHIIAGAL